MSKLLQGKRALVTGGSRGLGHALCLALAREGARVAFSYNRSDDGARSTLAEIEAEGTEGRSYKASVIDNAATEAMLADIDAAWGGLDILVNNAGITQNLPLALLE